MPSGPACFCSLSKSFCCFASSFASCFERLFASSSPLASFVGRPDSSKAEYFPASVPSRKSSSGLAAAFSASCSSCCLSESLLTSFSRPALAAFSACSRSSRRMASGSSNIQRKPSPRSSRRTPSETKSLSLTSSQRARSAAAALSPFAAASMSLQKASKAAAQSPRPAFLAAAAAGPARSTAFLTAAASRLLARASCRTSCRRPANASRAGVQAASLLQTGARPSTPRIPRMRVTSSAA
mmetsp:Transcript_7388/g.21669  ORF Transcript_7388/g.21669 Transcript_7388/m.21669 type:complete len:240 (+) Transcript_7388:116-835(+)